MQFRMPSIDNLRDELVRTIKRFPVTSVFVVLATIVLTIVIHKDLSWSRANVYIDLMFVLFLAFPISLGLHLVAENPPSWLKIPRNIIPLLSVIPVAAFYFWRHSHVGGGEMIRYFHWALYCHLFVAFAPFLQAGNPSAFWNFNYRLFISFLISRFFGGFLFAGLCMAFAAISSLLEVVVPPNTYAHTAAICLVLISTMHFLALVPKDLSATEEHPKILKIFCQYILVPLNVLYILILYTYMFKVLSSGHWPKGMISWLVSGVAILGVFALLMMSTFFHLPENKWMKKFQSIYYLSIIPLLIMGITSVGQRIGQYQVTEKRYVLIVLSVWLIGIALYNLISKTKNIVVIPVSLFVITFLTSFGPWGIYEVSWKSQWGRLEKILTKYEAYKDGHLVKNEKVFTSEDAFEVKEILSYLVYYHSAEKLPFFLTVEEEKLLSSGSYLGSSYRSFDDAETFMRQKFNVPTVVNKNGYSEPTYTYSHSQMTADLEDGWFFFHYGAVGSFTAANGRRYFIRYDRQHELTLVENDKDVLTWDISAELEEIRKEPRSGKQLRWTKKTDRFEVIFLPEYVSGYTKDGHIDSVSLNGKFFIHVLR